MVHRIVTAVLFVAFGAAHSAAAPKAPLAEVEILGSGETKLLLIPCMSCRWRSWDQFLERNKDRYEMYAVTLAGFGGSPRPDLPIDSDEPVWHRAAVASLVALLDEHDLKEVVAVGNSFGSKIAMELAVAHPGRVSKIINFDTPLFLRTPYPPDRNDRIKAARNIVATYGPRLEDPEKWRKFNTPSIDDADRRMLYHGMFMATDRTSMLQYWRENFLIDFDTLLRSLDIPVLDVKTISRRDKTPEQSRTKHINAMKQAGAGPSVQTVIFYDTGHFVMEDRPELVDRVVADFIAGRTISDHRPVER